MNIITDYPLWFVVFCILLGAGFAAIVYYRNPKLKETTKSLILTLSFLRATSVALIAFLLLNPLIKSINNEKQLPIIAILQDNSQSIVQNKDSLFYRQAYQKKLQQLTQKLREHYKVKVYAFGNDLNENDSLMFNFSDLQTDITHALQATATRLNNTNIGAIILASDGIYNKNTNPIYFNQLPRTPIYTIALGDTTQPKDIILEKVNHNTIAYLGNQFVINPEIAAYGLKGKNTSVAVFHKGKQIANQTFNIDNDNFFKSFTFIADAQNVGIQRYDIVVKEIAGEKTIVNNKQSIFIDVLDNRQKILILANAPHPDIAAMQAYISLNQNYEVETALINDFNKPIKPYSLIILHQLPSTINKAQSILQQIQQNNLPALFILGEQTSLKDFNALQTGLNIAAAQNTLTNTTATINSSFALFMLSPETQETIKQLPPLQALFGTYQMSNAVNVLCFQKIGAVSTSNPLIFFNDKWNNNKIGVVTAEGLWRWRMTNYAIKQNFEAFNELLDKSIQYLAVKEDKSLFKVVSKRLFTEAQNVTFTAEVFNNSYERYNQPDVYMSITTPEKKKLDYTFSKIGDAYQLDAGKFPTGQYHYEAKVNINGTTHWQKGEFSVSKLLIEQVNTVANHQLLNNLASQSNGKMYYPADMEKITEELLQRKDIKPIVFTQEKLNDAVSFKILFFLALLLLTIEWSIKKYLGII